MNNHIADQRASIYGNQSSILDRRTLQTAHKQLAERLEPGMTVLDIGCGTGAITKDIAIAVGEKGRVVGMDNNPSFIEKARTIHADVPNVQFEERTIYHLNKENSFDLVTCSRVLQWLANPLEALRQMVLATKVGGRVIVLDYNHEKIIWDPLPPKSTNDFYSSFLKWRADAGMDNAIADHMQSLFHEAGLTHTNVTAQHEETVHYDTNFDQRAGIWADVMAGRGRQMVMDQYIKEEERAIAERDYREWVTRSAKSQTMYLLAVEGIKR
ncbi:methyltransferase domain-containing protein [Alkalihalobacillus sp. FSL W8-0930]